MGSQPGAREVHAHVTTHPLNLPCPACRQAMQVSTLRCSECGLRVEGEFGGNEFARLDDESLQLLRVFVYCEGRIRDMEKALGVSYPTVKAKVAALRATLGLQANDSGSADADDSAAESGAATVVPEATNIADAAASQRIAILDALSRGEITHYEALRQLRGEAD